jgi:hypothetical protein
MLGRMQMKKKKKTKESKRKNKKSTEEEKKDTVKYKENWIGKEKDSQRKIFLPYGRSIGSWMSYTQDVYMSHGTEYVFSMNGG